MMQRVRPAYNLFQKIAEPRVRRLIYFVMYVLMCMVGTLISWRQPNSFKDLIGPELVWIFGGMIATGAFLGMLSVLPGIWWLERAGLMFLYTGLAIYYVIAIWLGVSPSGVLLAIFITLAYILRWMEITGKPLAPRKE